MSRVVLKPLAKQVVVLTGGTSGIGLTTACMLAKHGAKLYLIARNEEALKAVQAEIHAKGGQAEYAVADVADNAALREAANAALSAYGGFDTWINDAGAFIYGRLDKVALEDQRRLFDVTYWGVVNGTLVAAEHLRHGGGAIINVGSILGEVAIPYQGAYCAAKFAVKGFTEAFRRETEADRLPISLTLIKPAAINTPFTDQQQPAPGNPQDQPCSRSSVESWPHARGRRGICGLHFGRTSRFPPPSALNKIEAITPDGRYLVVRGRLWRRSNPGLSDDERATLVAELMEARRDKGAAIRRGDIAAREAARQRVNVAKVALGERGPVWWTDDAPDLNRHMVRNTPYAEWFDGKH